MINGASNELDQLVTGRVTSCFVHDFEVHRSALKDALGGASIAIIGAAGSIGAAVTQAVLSFVPKRLALLDLSENGLVDLMRQIRTEALAPSSVAISALPIGLGSREFSDFMVASAPYDYILNLAALKHVRSEKSIFSLRRMIDTNFLDLHDFLAALRRPHLVKRMFSVSSDKAVNPASFMGASKNIMEQVLALHAERQPFATARFANVAFSAGSLLEGFLQRMDRFQPLAAPSDVRRYFISRNEAAELCLLALVQARPGEALFPHLGEQLPALTFPAIAERLLRRRGFEPVLCESEQEARLGCAAWIAEGRWPCFFAPSSTSGEKELEEFFNPALETDGYQQFKHIGAVKVNSQDDSRDRLVKFLEFCQHARQTGCVGIADYQNAFAQAVPGFAHVASAQSLDDKM